MLREFELDAQSSLESNERVCMEKKNVNMIERPHQSVDEAAIE